MAQSVLDSVTYILLPVVLFYISYNRAHGGSLGASADQTAQVHLYLLPGQTDSKLFGALFGVLDALFFVSFLSSFFDVVFYLFSEPLGVDFELPN